MVFSSVHQVHGEDASKAAGPFPWEQPRTRRLGLVGPLVLVCAVRELAVCGFCATTVEPTLVLGAFSLLGFLCWGDGRQEKYGEVKTNGNGEPRTSSW